VTDRGKQLIGAELRVVNIGLDLFAAALEDQGVTAVHVDWRPPAGGDPRLSGLLERLKGGAAPPSPRAG
jgi:FdrA protein